ncbi:hypothetical protein SK069_18995 [Patulibacter brassicae]|uniref:SMP-30/Gluconolactonase/LRE-like region domain-containing protein n=1 Tax=Patulibacter brassicae TaxID=1705717 RepID=A0ABU4VRW8_9ACTN|nr:hypothetical protein [Patulibacter brassicae]MDX8153691.1 hypothetical protein [Patulibacter brassicae]
MVHRASFRSPRRALPLAAATASLALGLPAVAGAAPSVDGDFALPEQPVRLAAGPDGNVWATIGGADDVARVTPDGTVTTFDLPGVTSPVGIASGPDGALWVTQSGGVARFAAADPAGTTTATPLPSIVDPREIVAGRDGVLWSASGDKVLRIPSAAPATATATTVPGMSARSIALGADGGPWIADFGNERVVHLQADGSSPSFASSRSGGGPQGIAAAPDGRVAFTDPTANPHVVGRLTPGGTPAFTELPGTDPFGIVHAADGAFWTAQFAGDRVSRIADDGTVTSVALPAGSGPRYLTPGPAGSTTVWVGLETTKRIVRISGLVPPTSGGGTGGGGAAGTGDAPGTGGPGTTPVTIRGLRVSPARFVPGTRLRAATRRRAAVGTRISLRSNVATTVTLRIERAVMGRRKGGTCRPKGQVRRGASCVRRWTGVTTIRKAVGTTTTRVTFLGRVKGRSLPAGRYRVRATLGGATAGGPSAAFRIG